MYALAAMLQMVAPAPLFAPPLDTPLIVVTRRTTERGDTLRRFEVERRIVFRRDARGLFAEVTLLRAEANSREAWASMFEAGYASLTGQRLTMRLDPHGRVTAIDAIDSLWARFCNGIAELAASQRIDATPEARSALAERLLVPLRAMPDARRIAIFATLASELVAGEAFAGGAGSTAEVRVPGRTALGGAVTVDGMRTVSSEDGLLHSRTYAAGTVPLPASDATDEGGARAAEMEITLERRAEPDTGLVRSARETVRSRIDSGDAHQAQTITTTMTVTDEVRQGI